jgi:hypothetical protein
MLGLQGRFVGMPFLAPEPKPATHKADSPGYRAAHRVDGSQEQVHRTPRRLIWATIRPYNRPLRGLTGVRDARFRAQIDRRLRALLRPVAIFGCADILRGF